MLDLKTIFELLKDRDPAAMARISAFFLAPGVILGLVVSGVLGGSFGLDFERPITISQLRTETRANGNVVARSGFALIVEPVSSEYRVELLSIPSQMWSSLDQQSALANRDRLRLDGAGVSGKAPLLGVSEPVTVIVEGQLGEKILLPGGAVSTDNWQLPSRRSDSIVFNVLLACVFAFGMSLATGLPSDNRDNQATG